MEDDGVVIEQVRRHYWVTLTTDDFPGPSSLLLEQIEVSPNECPAEGFASTSLNPPELHVPRLANAVARGRRRRFVAHGPEFLGHTPL